MGAGSHTTTKNINQTTHSSDITNHFINDHKTSTLDSNRNFLETIKGDRSFAEGADLSGTARTGLTCIGMKAGDPECRLMNLQM